MKLLKDGKAFKNGDIISTEVYLGKNDKAENWAEIDYEAPVKETVIEETTEERLEKVEKCLENMKKAFGGSSTLKSLVSKIFKE